MFTVTTPRADRCGSRIVSHHSTAKKAISRAKRLVFKGPLPSATVEYQFRRATVTRSYHA